MLRKAADNSTAQASCIIIHLQNTLLFTYEMRMNKIMSDTAKPYRHFFTL